MNWCNRNGKPFSATKDNLDKTTQRLDQTQTEVENVKREKVEWVERWWFLSIYNFKNNGTFEIIQSPFFQENYEGNSQLVANILATVENMKKGLNGPRILNFLCVVMRRTHTDVTTKQKAKFPFPSKYSSLVSTVNINIHYTPEFK